MPVIEVHLKDTIGTDRTIFRVDNDTDLSAADFARKCLRDGVEIELSEKTTAVVNSDQIRHITISRD